MFKVQKKSPHAKYLSPKRKKVFRGKSRCGGVDDGRVITSLRSEGVAEDVAPVQGDDTVAESSVKVDNVSPMPLRKTLAPVNAHHSRYGAVSPKKKRVSREKSRYVNVLAVCVMDF